jgi:predicted GIY-YIG superfamily endonuclease
MVENISYNHIPNSCLYFLFFRDALVYVGETKNLRNRLSNHHQEHQYTHVRWIACLDEKRKEYEKRLIRNLKPILNHTHNTENPNKKFSLFKPVPWIYSYSQMNLFKHYFENYDWCCLKMGIDEVEYLYKKWSLEFDFKYRKSPLDGTILDGSLWGDNWSRSMLL